MAAQADLSLTWSKTPKTGFLVSEQRKALARSAQAGPGLH